jgi:hypothetical protein
VASGRRFSASDTSLTSDVATFLRTIPKAADASLWAYPALAASVTVRMSLAATLTARPSAAGTLDVEPRAVASARAEAGSAATLEVL